MLIKSIFHSVVDVITNSSTVIYTYQNSVDEAKELVQEVLKLSGVTDKTSEDIFFYGVFCENDTYLEFDSEEIPEFEGSYEEKRKWLDDLIVSILKGEIERPSWMISAENESYFGGWVPSSYLYLMPKEEKYRELGEKIKRLLCSPSFDGGRDG